MVSSTYEYTIEQYIQVASELKTLCKPLFQSTHIKDFGYLYFDKSKACIPIVTNLEFLRHYLEGRGYARQLSVLEFDEVKSGYYDPKALPSTDIEEDDQLCKKYGMYDCFTIIKKYETFFEDFTFTCGSESMHHFNFYLNNLKLLEEFIEEITPKLHEKAKGLLKLPVHWDWDDKTQVMGRESFMLSHANSFLGQEGESEEADKFVKLTEREKSVLYHCLLGKSAKQIASDLNLSLRTIQNYIEKIKQKYKCDSITHLLSVFVSKEHIAFFSTKTKPKF